MPLNRMIAFVFDAGEHAVEAFDPIVSTRGVGVFRTKVNDGLLCGRRCVRGDQRVLRRWRDVVHFVAGSAAGRVRIGGRRGGCEGLCRGGGRAA